MRRSRPSVRVAPLSLGGRQSQANQLTSLAMSLLESARAFDERISSPLALPQRARLARALAVVAAHSGDAAVWAALIMLAMVFGDLAWKGRALITAVGLVVAELVVVGVKFILRRPRPEGTSGMIYRRMDPYSFPSGHAARAAMLAVFSASLCPAGFAAAIGAWGPLMLLARITIRIHYVLDVAVGLALGTGLGFGVLAATRLVAAAL